MAILTISDFLKEILEFKSIISSYNIYYRGQNNGFRQGWGLLPTFYRERKQHPEISFYTDKKEEINIIYKFIEKNYEYFKSVEFNDLISVINILQHYGFPTRVLDVTQNPLVALYFALEKVEQGDSNNPVVYIIYAKTSNAAFLINSEINKFYNESVTEKKRLYPAILVNGCNISERIRSQKGDFILFFEDVDINRDPTFSIKEIQIDVNSIEYLKEELNLLGISESTIYPSLSAETKRLKDDLLNTYKMTKNIGEVVKNTMSKKTSNTSDLLNSALEEQNQIERKYLNNNKKMFAGLKLRQ